MKLKNGAEESDRLVAMIMMTLRDLKEEDGKGGLLAARKIADGARPDTVTAQMLDSYGLTTRGKMGSTARNVILCAVTGKGELTSPE